MISIDGLISGFDTQSIIDGLLEVSQSQIDRLNTKKTRIVAKQAAFGTIEAQLASLRGQIASLGRTQNNILEGKLASSSDEDILQVSANQNAVNGVYTVTVNSLAAAHQVASNSFDSTDSQITQGDFTIQVGNGASTTVTIDSTNDSVQGLVDAINTASSEAFASLVTDSNGSRILLTGKETGASQTIQITNNLGPTSGGATQPDFSGDAVQNASDATVTIGSGAGAITVNSVSNQFNNVLEGLTFNVTSANASKPVNISVQNDVETSEEAVQNFVDSFNSLMESIDSQSGFNAETEQGGILLGERSVIGIQDDIRNKLIFAVPGLDAAFNQLSAIGVNFNDKGRLFINSARLGKALNGELDGVGTTELKRLFALDGNSTNSGISFILGSSKTEASSTPFEVDISQAAEKATVVGTALAESIVIGSGNKTFEVEVDSRSTGTLELTEGTYTRQELADHLEVVINGSDLKGRSVSVSVSSDGLKLVSNIYGNESRLENFSGTALTDLGLTTSDQDTGQDVVGKFIVDGQVEEAIGSGRVLSGSTTNSTTADIQLKVTLNASQISNGSEGQITVTRGFASQLDQIIGGMLDPVTGQIKTTNDRYDAQIESLDVSIQNTEELIQIKSDQLVSQFIAMEQALANIQNQNSFLIAQLPAVNLGVQ
ncbi:MAG: flagellar filament capping protein FliD [Planctomycetota bacterium]|nr:flagellar filament capping protein FliD [Planctomycetota bacterium]